MAVFAASRSISAPTALAHAIARPNRRSTRFVVRAEADQKASPVVENEQAVEATSAPPSASYSTSPALPDYNAMFSFTAPDGPETMNGRLAMIGFVSAVAAELASGDSLAQQLNEWGFIGFCGVSAIFTVASLVPMFLGAKKEAFGPFTPEKEMLNGRAAMIGLIALLGVEAVKGSALF